MREKLIELLDKIDVYDDWLDNGYIAEQLIANGVTIPVRCKDCHNFTKSKWCNLLMMDVKDDGFCDKGERRTDDE